MKVAQRSPKAGKRVYFSVDVEPDCPPYLWTDRGLTEGMPRLLDLLDQIDVPTTFFITGQVALDHPAMVRDVLDRGHEIGSHGFSHKSFAEMDEAEAREEIRSSIEVLSQHAPISLFRAPYLRFPERFTDILADCGVTFDSSQAKYKKRDGQPQKTDGLERLPVSMTSSVLRLPTWLRDPWLSTLRDPVVLFVHPWEFVDFRDSNLRWDCRAGTGQHALDSVASLAKLFRRRGFSFHKISDYTADAKSDVAPANS